MPAQQKLIAHETVVRARDDYVAAKKVALILKENGIASDKFYRLLAGKDEAFGMPAIPLRHDLLGARSTRTERARASLISRLWRTADRQVRDVEKRLKLNTQASDQRERDARVLATMVKTLRELRALDAAQAQRESSTEDENGPDNLDDFRRELARKMDAIIARRSLRSDGGAEC